MAQFGSQKAAAAAGQRAAASSVYTALATLALGLPSNQAASQTTSRPASQQYICVQPQKRTTNTISNCAWVKYERLLIPCKLLSHKANSLFCFSSSFYILTYEKIKIKLSIFIDCV